MRFVEKDILKDNLVKEAKLLLKSSRNYNSSDRVKVIIRILYSSCCAFCQSSPEDSSFYQIEHFYPKGLPKYSKYKKSIENLHYSCQRCNTLKSTEEHLDIFSPNYYLDSKGKWHLSTDTKISKEIFFKGHLVFSKNTTPRSINRGKATIDLFDLNNKNGATERSSRQHLVESRLRTYKTVADLIKALYNLIVNYHKENNEAIEILLAIAIGHTDKNRPYSTMVSQNFSSDIYKISSIYLKLKKKYP